MFREQTVNEEQVPWTGCTGKLKPEEFKTDQNAVIGNLGGPFLGHQKCAAPPLTVLVLLVSVLRRYKITSC